MPAKKKAKKKVATKKVAKKATKKVTLTKPKAKAASTVARTPKQTAEKLAHDKIVRAAKGGAVVVDTVPEKREGAESYSVVIRGGKAVKVLDSDNPDLY